MLINGVLCNVVGRVCMDQTIVDVSNVPDIKTGDIVYVYSDKCRDGRESLAEAFVKYRNGEDIPDEARKLIGKYILHWRRV